MEQELIEDAFRLLRVMKARFELAIKEEPKFHFPGRAYYGNIITLLEKYEEQKTVTCNHPGDNNE